MMIDAQKTRVLHIPKHFMLNIYDAVEVQVRVHVQLTSRSRILPEKLIVFQKVIHSSPFTEFESSFPCQQEPSPSHMNVIDNFEIY